MLEKGCEVTPPPSDGPEQRKPAATSRRLLPSRLVARMGSAIWQQKAKLLGLGLTIAFVVLLVRSVDLAEVKAALVSANYLYVLPAAAVTLGGYGLRTYRWKRILTPTRDVPTTRLFPVLIIGFATNNILPARVGELARAYALGRKEGISKTLTLASVVLERLLDGLTLVGYIAVLSLFFPLPGWGTDLAKLGVLVFLGLGIVVVVLLARERLALSLLEVGLRTLPEQIGKRLMGMAESGMLGLRVLRVPGELPTIAACSAAVWLCEAASYFLIIRSFNLPLGGTSHLFAAVLVLVVVNLGIMVPSAPGYIGTFHFFVVLALSAFGVGREAALGVALVSHAMQYVMITGLGLAFLWRQQFSLSAISGEEPSSVAETKAAMREA